MLTSSVVESHDYKLLVNESKAWEVLSNNLILGPEPSNPRSDKAEVGDGVKEPPLRGKTLKAPAVRARRGSGEDYLPAARAYPAARSGR